MNIQLEDGLTIRESTVKALLTSREAIDKALKQVNETPLSMSINTKVSIYRASLAISEEIRKALK